MSFWTKLKDYIGVGISKNVSPPSAPDFMDAVGGDLVKKAKAKPAAKKTSVTKKK
jgi:hypothetical protein